MVISGWDIRIQKTVLAGAGLATLIFVPSWLLDPINIPKLSVLSICGLAIGGLLFSDYRSVIARAGRPAFLGSLGFILVALVAFFANGSGTDQFFGQFGRNTGLLAYIALPLFFLGSASVAHSPFAKKLLSMLILVGGINAIYGLLQWRGVDLVNWDNPFSPILGTLGNPNFASALLGIAATAAFAFALGNVSTRIRFSLLALVALKVFLAFESDAIQGVLVFLIGAVIVIYARFIRNRKVLLQVSYIAVIAVSGLLALFGMLQKGPLTSIMYQTSVTYRGDYWRAGWSMTLERPFTGVGIDRYGDWYRTVRTLESTERRGPDITANSAHNVFLDISSGGGFPLLVAYTFLIGLALVAGFKLLKRSGKYDPLGIGLLATWIGYLAQSLVSINQLGIAVWGWTLPGALVGYVKWLDVNKSEHAGKPNSVTAVSAKAIVSGFLGTLIGLLLGVIPVVRDASFVSAVKSTDANAVKSATLTWPRDSFYFDFFINLLFSNKMNREALEMSREAVAINPRRFAAWFAIVNNPEAPESERMLALEKCKSLDPMNKLLPDSPPK